VSKPLPGCQLAAIRWQYKDNVWFAEAPLLEGGAYPNRNGIEEDIGEGSIHGDDVSPCFFVEGMF
jgi:hypothetical protein